MIFFGGIIGLLLLTELGASAGSMIQPFAAADTPTPELDPAIQLLPAQGDPATNITVTGTGWQPDDIVAVSLKKAPEGEPIVLADTTAAINESGAFSLTFPLPALDFEWTGRPVILITVQSQTTNASAVAEFEIAATRTPTLTPTDLPTHTPTFTPTPIPTPTEPNTPTPAIGLNSWYGEYWANPVASGRPAHIENVQEINFEWGYGAPAANLPVDNFSAQWTRQVIFEEGYYRFQIEANGGARFWLDGRLLIDKQQASATFEVSNQAVTAGLHRLRVEFYEYTGPANILFNWREVAPIPDPAPTFTPLATATPIPTFTPTSTPTPNSQTVALQAARQHLASLTGLPASEIEVVSIEAREWPNSQLGCPTEDVAGLPVITPGYQIILEARGQQYDYHTDEEGRVVLCEPDLADRGAEDRPPTEINP